MSEAAGDPLQELLARLIEDAALLHAHEEATKQSVILPILARLGWDRENVREVVPESRVGNGRVDYCLRVAERSLVFIEAKRTDQDLEKHQEQLLEYAFREGVEIAALTNGVLWWLYLPLLGGSWEQRKFFTIDIVQQGAEAAAEHFRSYLAKAASESGSAVQCAKQLHRSREKERLTSTTLPRAWSMLCEGPDELLVELLAEKVESLCGHRPTPDQVAQFLEGVTAGPSPATPETHQPGPSPRSESRPIPPRPSNLAHGFSFTRPTAFTIFGRTRPASTFKEVLVGVCEAVAARHASDFEQVLLQLRGWKRDFFSRDYRGMTSPEKVPGTDIYVETNLGANDTVKRCREVLRIFGYDPESLRVDTQNPRTGAP